MSDEKFMNKYSISSARAQWHEYNGGNYFVTICTKNRFYYFGEIVNNGCRDGLHNFLEPTMNLTPIGEFADKQFRNVTKHYPYAEIPLWVVMPNHIHAIVVIRGNENDFDCRRAVARRNRRDVARNVSTDEKKHFMSAVAPKRNTLSVVMRGIKSAVTKFANENGIPFEWQFRFHDRIIRNTDEMNRIAKYIEENMAKWQCDELYGELQTPQPNIQPNLPC